MAEQITFQAEFDDSELVAKVDELIQKLSAADRGVSDFGDSATDVFKELTESIEDQDNALKNTLKSQADYKKRTDSSASSQRNFKSTIIDSVKDIKILGVSLGDVAEQLKAKAEGLRSVQKGLAGGTKGLGLFKRALISTGIGAIVVAFGSLVALLTRTQKGIDFVNKTLDIGSTIVDIFIDRAALLGTAIVKLFQGDFKGAYEDAKDSVGGLTEEIAKETAASAKLSDAKVQLRENERALNVEYEQQRARIEELRNIGEDTTRSAQERSKALQDALEIENNLAARRTELAEENLRIIKESNDLGNTLTEDLDKQAEAEAELARIRQEAAGRQREVANQLRAINAETLAQIRALRDEYDSLLNDLAGRVTEANLSALTGVERLQAERNLAIQEVNNFADEIRRAAAAAGSTLPADFDAQLAALFGEIENSFESEVKKLREGDPLLNPVDVLPSGVDYEEKGKIDAESYLAGFDNTVTQDLPIIDNLKNKLLEALDINEAQLQFIGEAVSGAFGNVVDGFDILTQSQIENQDRLIEALDERIEETQAKLDEERSRREAGLANDAQILEQSLADQQEKRRKAEEARLELEKKAARQRIIANGLEQASALTLSVAKLTASEASKGIVGIATAVAGAAIIFSLIAQAKAQANQFAESPAFRDGTPYVHGPGGPREDKVPAWLSSGERVVPAWINDRLGGERVSNEELMNYFLLGRNLKNIGFNLPDLEETIKQGRKNEIELITIKQETNWDAMQKAYENAASKSAQQMISYWQTRPVEYIDSDGVKVIERMEGGVIKRQRITKK